MKHVRSLLYAVLVAQMVEFRGWLAGAEGKLFDFYSKVEAELFWQPTQNVLIVSIDPESYKKCFAGTSPLNPENLLMLVQAVADAHPAVIGVDIRTEGEAYLSAESAKHLHDINAPPTVWAGGQQILQPEEGFWGWFFGDAVPVVVNQTAVLGTSPPELHVKWAVPAYPRELDRAVRRFPTQVKVAESDVEMLSWAALIAQQRKKDLKPKGEVYLSYLRNIPVYPLSKLFREECPWGAVKLDWDPKLVRDKVVLIGGGYDEADVHATPLQEKTPGVMVNAHAVEAVLAKDDLREVPRWLLFLLLDIPVGWLLSRAFRFATIRATMRAAAAILAAIILLSFLLFLGGYSWISWIGVLLGFAPDMIHQMYERIKEHERPA